MRSPIRSVTWLWLPEPRSKPARRRQTARSAGHTPHGASASARACYVKAASAHLTLGFLTSTPTSSPTVWRWGRRGRASARSRSQCRELFFWLHGLAVRMLNAKLSTRRSCHALVRSERLAARWSGIFDVVGQPLGPRVAARAEDAEQDRSCVQERGARVIVAGVREHERVSGVSHRVALLGGQSCLRERAVERSDHAAVCSRSRARHG